MSDRPMRLKYLTKMKIILCIFLLCITAVSVFGEPQELNGIVGKSIEFPAAVKIDGNLRYSGLTIGDVASSRFTAASNVEYSDRVQWDSSTGLFSLSGLKMEDSGEYKVQNTDQDIITVFQLNVYKGNVPVSKPNVIFHNEYPCTIECTAERGTEATLSWYREGQKEPYVSSRVASAPYLHLPQTVERSGTYTCEVKNSVSNEKASITVGDHCTGPSAGTIVAIFIAVVAVLIAVVFAVLYRRAKKERRGEQALLKKAVTRVIRDEDNQVLLQNVEENQGLIRDDFKRLILVTKLLDNIVAPASDEDRQAFIHDAFTRLVLVQEISQEMVSLTHVKKLLDILVAPASDENKQADFLSAVTRAIRDVKDILDKVDPCALRTTNWEGDPTHLREDLS